MKLSVCLIVKNEQDNIVNILKCVKKFADEIVVTDTGSSDNTKLLASKFTSKIYDYAWTDDFASARNFCFSKACGDYLMWIDCDDYITNSNIKKIIQLKKSNDYDTYFFKYVLPCCNNDTTFYRERIVKNCSLAKFNGFIHEAIQPFGRCKFCDITIIHNKKNFTNRKRNLKIFNKHIKNGEILDGRLTYYYAKELYYNGYFKKCIKVLSDMIKKNAVATINLRDSYITLSNCYHCVGNERLSKKVLLMGLSNGVCDSELLCLLGEKYKKTNVHISITFYKMALCCNKDESDLTFYNGYYYYFCPLINLCVLYYQIKNYDMAFYYHKLCKKYYPKNQLVIYNDKFFK